MASCLGMPVICFVVAGIFLHGVVAEVEVGSLSSIPPADCIYRYLDRNVCAELHNVTFDIYSFYCCNTTTTTAGGDCSSMCWNMKRVPFYKCVTDCCKGYYWGDQQTCEKVPNDINCLNGGSPWGMPNGGLYCHCPPGFVGSTCEKPECFCANGGSCTVMYERPTCQCQAGYYGRYCEYRNCSKLQCSNGGQCVKDGDNEMCICNLPFVGRYCELVHSNPPECPVSTAISGRTQDCQRACYNDSGCNSTSVCCSDGCSLICKSKNTGCQQDGMTFAVGQSYRPPNSPCMNCTCKAPGDMRCDATTMCPAYVCENGTSPVIQPGHCCPTCTGPACSLQCWNDGTCYRDSNGTERCRCHHQFVGRVCETYVPSSQCPASSAVIGPTVCNINCMNDHTCNYNEHCCYEGCSKVCKKPAPVTCHKYNQTFTVGQEYSPDDCTYCYCNASGSMECYTKGCAFPACRDGDRLITEPGQCCPVCVGTCDLPCNHGGTCLRINGIDRCHCTSQYAGKLCELEHIDSSRCPTNSTYQPLNCTISCRSDDGCYGDSVCCKEGCSLVCKGPKPVTCHKFNQTFTVEQTYKPDPCTKCTCDTSGRMECMVYSCAYPACTNFVTVPDKCCPVCPGTCNLPCYNGGTCVNRNGVEMCFCTSQYVGKLCDILHTDNARCPVTTALTNHTGNCNISCRYDYNCPTDQFCCKEGCNLVCKKPTPVQCYKDNQTFAIGDIYSPDDCTHCTCTTYGRMECVVSACSYPGCANPVKLPGQCCAVCTGMCSMHCYNGGTCVNRDGNEICICTSHFFGKKCEIEHFDSHKCPANTSVASHPGNCNSEILCKGDDTCYGDQVCCQEGCSLVCKTPKPATCYDYGQTFSVGQTYSPDPCMNCTCESDGNMMCMTVDCFAPERCQDGSYPNKKSNQCCPSCTVPCYCYNGGSCLLHQGREVCTCPTGFSGMYCEDGAGSCTLQCLNGGWCYREGEREMCKCNGSYAGKYCEIKHTDSYLCPNMSVGTNYSGNCDILCRNDYGCYGDVCCKEGCSLVCKKPTNTTCKMDGRVFSLGEQYNQSACTLCKCQENGYMSCTQIKCAYPECLNGLRPVTEPGACCLTCPGPCNCSNGGYCQVQGAQEVCVCPTGFYGQYCQYGSHCSLYCYNGGSCFRENYVDKCYCPEPFFGKHCEIKHYDSYLCPNTSAVKNYTENCDISCEDNGGCYGDMVCCKEGCKLVCKKPKNATCKMDGLVFTLGEQYNQTSCTVCTCQDTGYMRCMAINCVHPECLNGLRPVTQPGACCPTCPGPCDCTNGGYCQLQGRQEVCVCPTGFYGHHCQYGSPCTLECYNGGSCFLDNYDFKCYCPEPFFGKHCEIKHYDSYLCPNTSAVKNYTENCDIFCEDHDECYGDKVCCKEGCKLVCKKPKNVTCKMDGRVFTVGQQYNISACTLCTCRENGNMSCIAIRCAYPECLNGLEAVTEPGACCATCPGPCSCTNGGSCDLQGAQEVCVCPTGFYGKYCQYGSSCSLQCANGGSCFRENYVDKCYCPEPYFGKTCEIKHFDSYQCPNTSAVTSNTGYCDVACTAERGCNSSTVCCKEGCSLVCKKPKPPTCRVDGRNFTLGEEYSPNDCTHCNCSENGHMVCAVTDCAALTCRNGSYPVKKPGKCCNTCSGPCYCENGGSCMMMDNELKCKCQSGYEGEHCEKRSCSINCYNGGSCWEDFGEEKCACPSYFIGRNCERIFNESYLCPDDTSDANSGSGSSDSCWGFCDSDEQCFGISVCCMNGCRRECKMPRNVTCLMDGYRLSVGQTYQPEPCKNCTCLQSGNMVCRTRSCPSLNCAHYVTKPGACCAECAAPPPEPPKIFCPKSPVMIEVGPNDRGVRLSTYNTKVVAYDNKNASLPVLFEPTSLWHCTCNQPDLYYNSVVAETTDKNGNMTRCTFRVYVKDPHPPVMTSCPGDINIFMDEKPRWQEPTFTDNVGVADTKMKEYQLIRTSFTGEYDVEYKALDYDGNQVLCEFTVSMYEKETPFAELPAELQARSAPKDDDDGKSTDIGLIIGPVAGAIGLIALIATVVICLKMRRGSDGSPVGTNLAARNSHIYSVPSDVIIKPHSNASSVYSVRTNPPALNQDMKTSEYAVFQPPTYSESMGPGSQGYANHGYQTLDPRAMSNVRL